MTPEIMYKIGLLNVEARELNDAVWQGRDADQLTDAEIPLAMATREILQKTSSLLLDVSDEGTWEVYPDGG